MLYIYLGTNSDSLPTRHSLVFITELECVYWAVPAESMNITEVLSGLVMAQAVGRRSLNAGTHVQYQYICVRFVAVAVKPWHISFPVLQFSPKNNILEMLHTNIH